jgi:hypothetical protein
METKSSKGNEDIEMVEIIADEIWTKMSH